MFSSIILSPRIGARSPLNVHPVSRASCQLDVPSQLQIAGPSLRQPQFNSHTCPAASLEISNSHPALKHNRTVTKYRQIILDRTPINQGTLSRQPRIRRCQVKFVSAAKRCSKSNTLFQPPNKISAAFRLLLIATEAQASCCSAEKYDESLSCVRIRILCRRAKIQLES